MPVVIAPNGYNPVTQTKFYIDPINGNDGYTGSTLISPIKTWVRFAQLTGGNNAYWNAGKYDIYFLNDVPTTDPTWILPGGIREKNSTIFIHGSATDGYGKSILYTGSVTTLANALNRTSTPQHSWEITDSAIPSSWTASSLIGKRLRFTSGSINALSWPILDLGSKTVKLCQVLSPTTLNVPITATLTSPSTIDGYSFVVESLTKIPSIIVNIKSNDDGYINTNSYGIIFDSLALGSGNKMRWNFEDTIYFYGCEIQMNSSPGLGTSALLSACHFTVTALLPINSLSTLVAGYSDCDVSIYGRANVLSDFMMQGAQLFVGESGRVSLTNFAGWAAPASGAFKCRGRGAFGGSAAIWGDTNTGVGVSVSSGSVLLINSGSPLTLTITGSSGDFALGSFTQVNPFNPATGLYGALQTCTWSALVAGTLGSEQYKCHEVRTGAGISNEGALT